MTDKTRLLNSVEDVVDWCNDNFDHFDWRCDSIEDATAKTFRLVDRKQKSDHGWINLAFLCIGALGTLLYFQDKKIKKMEKEMKFQFATWDQAFDDYVYKKELKLDEEG